mgnify:CR=1 FL=1
MSKNPLIKSYSSKIGERNGTKRIWIESKKLHETQLAEHLRYEPFYDFENKRIILRPGFANKITVKEKTNSLVAYIGVFGQQCRSSTGHFCNEIF